MKTKVVEVAKPMKMPPTLRLSEEDLPELKEWKVGGKYTVTLEVEQVESRKGDMMMMEGENKSPKISAEFKVLKAYTGEREENGEEMEESEEEKSEKSPKVAEALRRKLSY